MLAIHNRFERTVRYLMAPSATSRLRFRALKLFGTFALALGQQLSPDCLVSILKIVYSMGRGEQWALKFADSAGRPVDPGLLEGLTSSFGDYTECLSIVSPESMFIPEIVGQYCLVKPLMPYPSMDSLGMNLTDPKLMARNRFARLMDGYRLPHLQTVRAFVEAMNVGKGALFRYGLCIPGQCSAQEIEKLINKIQFPITHIPLEVGPECQVKGQHRSLDGHQTVAILILGLLAILAISSTCYDYITTVSNQNYQSTNHQTVHRCSDEWLTSFSLIKNTRSLYSVDGSSSSNTTNNNSSKYASLDTIRLLLILAVHMAHAFQYTTSLGIIALKKLYSRVFPAIFEDKEYMFSRNYLVIDSLITLSGFLLSYSVYSKLQKNNGRLNYLTFILKRWLRFATLMFGSVLFIYLFPLTGSGPIWHIGVGWVTTGCQNSQNLWKMLFFVHNFRDEHLERLSIANSKCNPPSWFLGVLMQLTLAGPLVVLLVYRSRKYGTLALVVLLAIGLFASIGPYLLFNIRPYLQLWDLDAIIYTVSKSFTWYNFTANNFITAFTVGIGYGLLLNSSSSRHKKSISKLATLLLNWLSLATCLAVYFYNITFWHLDHSAPLVNILLWLTIGKLFYCLGFGWLCFALCTGRAELLNKILSWYILRPIARLSFGIYILHYLVIMNRIFTNHYTYNMTDKYMYEHFIVDLIYDILLAYVFYMIIECPLTNITELLFGGGCRCSYRSRRQIDHDQLPLLLFF
ncbi:nose resistant to fluoxetine protein 6-like [Oppia nitens]|uniref:nose resistant to fluoxetine protein 6-like n=1 Tax=Oppia nitens TaxID=1686743 RepID=UPI0023DB2D4D|nr:nose resistant to fluoxetine protein 6-like [Oppia nitens]